MRVVALLFSTLLLATPALADCYSATAQCSGFVNHVVTTSGPSANTDCSQAELTSSAAFDVVAGTVYVEARTSGRHSYTESVRSNLHDDFTLGGLPAGTHVSLTAVGDMIYDNILVEGQGPCLTDADLTVYPLVNGVHSSGDTFDFASTAGEQSTTHQLRAAVDAVAGAPFELSLVAGVDATGGEGGYISGKLHFEGLPPGASITSCKGFVQDQPVAALARSWGSMKVLYR